MNRIFLSILVVFTLSSCGTAHLLPDNLTLHPDQPPSQWSIVASPYTLVMEILPEKSSTSFLSLTTRSRGFEHPLMELVLSTPATAEEIFIQLAYLSAEDIVINKEIGTLPSQQHPIHLTLKINNGGKFQITLNQETLTGVLKKVPAVAQLNNTAGKAQVVILSQGNKED